MELMRKSENKFWLNRLLAVFGVRSPEDMEENDEEEKKEDDMDFVPAHFQTCGIM